MTPGEALDARLRLAGWVVGPYCHYLIRRLFEKSVPPSTDPPSRALAVQSFLHDLLAGDTPTYVVTSDMADLVRHASEQLDYVPTVQPWEVPSGTGVMFMTWPLADLDDAPLRSGLFTWSDRYPVGSREDPTQQGPGLTIVHWVHSRELVERSNVNPLSGELARSSPYLPMDVTGWSFGKEATEIDAPGPDDELGAVIHYGTDTVVPNDPRGITHVHNLRKVLYSIWHLCNERVEREEVDRKARRRYERATRRPAPKISVVDIRRRSNPHPTGTSEHREWTHRWIVSGHWRRQWYPSVEEHRPIWIEPYVKGPEGLPIESGPAKVKVVKP